MHKRKCISASVLIDKEHRVYLFSNSDETKFLKEAAWHQGIQAALVQVNEAVVSVESEWDFSFARIVICVAVGYFAACEAEVNIGDIRC